MEKRFLESPFRTMSNSFQDLGYSGFDVLMELTKNVDGTINYKAYNRTKEVIVDKLKSAIDKKFPNLSDTKKQSMLEENFYNILYESKSSAKEFALKSEIPEDVNTLFQYSARQRVDMSRVKYMYETIDKLFNDFEDGQGEGIIRNMVFPIEMYQKHFQTISSVRQGMQSFWAEVSNLYGGFWNFQVVEDNDVKGRIGIVDFLIEEKNEIEDPSILANQSDRTTFKDYNFRPGEADKQYQKMFTFPLYSKDGIVKDFSLSIKLTSKAAVLVNYGTNTNILNSVGSGDGKDLGLIAYTYLLKKHRQEVSKPDTDNSNPINKSDAVLQDLSFEITKNSKVKIITADDKDGLDVLKFAIKKDLSTPFIMLTGHGI